MGMIAGIILAAFFKNEGGPVRKRYSWEMDEESEIDENDPDAYWNIKPGEKKKPEPPPPPEPPQINYIYKEEKPKVEDTDQSPKSLT